MWSSKFELHTRPCAGYRPARDPDRSVRAGCPRPGDVAESNDQGGHIRGPDTEARRHARADRVPSPLRRGRCRYDDGCLLRRHARGNDRRSSDRARRSGRAPRAPRADGCGACRRCRDRRADRACGAGCEPDGHQGSECCTVAGVQPARYATYPRGVARGHRAHHRPVRDGARVPARRRVRRHRDPPRARVSAERVPVTEAEPAHRRMGWQPREPGAVPSTGRAGGA